MKGVRAEETLYRLLSKVRTREIIAYDLESKDGPSQKPGFTRVFLAGVYDGDKFVSFRNNVVRRGQKREWRTDAIAEGGCIDQAMRYLLRKEYRRRYIYAHNGGNFDHLHVLPWITQHIDEFSYVVIPVQSSIQVLKVTERSSRHSWTFLDSIRLLPMSLAQAAKTFAVPGKLEHSLEMPERDPRWERYLQRDCEALYACVQKFQHTAHAEMGGEMGITAPSTAMKLFRRKYMGKGLSPAMVPQHRHAKECTGSQPTPHPRRKSVGETEPCTGCLHRWVRGAYYGGRTEVYRAEPYWVGRRTVYGGQGLSYYDINSSYPRAMLESMPAGVLKEYGPRKTRADFERLAIMAVGFVECEVEIPSSCYLPPLPYRHPKLGKLVFPTGRFSGTWAWSELQLLFDPMVGGRITKVVKSAWYGRKNLFFDFVKELYFYRDKSSDRYDEGMALVAKLMLNSLYGKFGMNEERREIYVLGKDEAPPEGATLAGFEDGPEDALSKVCYLDKRVAPSYIIPQISAEITALARVRLWHFMARVLRMGGRLYYCDTDSLITDLADLPCSPELGELKNEFPGERIDVELVGPKMYLLRKSTPFTPDGKLTKLAMKGLPKEMRTEETLRALQAGETIHFKRLEKLGAMAAKGFLSPPAMQSVTKRHVTTYDKRTMLADGDTAPLVIDDRPPNKASTKALVLNGAMC